VEFLVSENGTDFKSVGFGELARVVFAYNFSTVKPAKPVKARYVRAKIEPGTLPFVFVSEMTVGVPEGTNPVPALRVAENTFVAVDNDGKACYLFGEEITPSAISRFFSLNVEFKKADGSAAKSTDKLGTGYKISYYNEGKLADTYTVILSGDINGDGKITPLDYLLVKKAYIRTQPLNQAQQLAVDTNLDGKFNSFDILLVKKHIINTADIFEKIKGKVS
jgi:hypothetical protein